MLWKKLSDGQLIANRENAKKSTGPRSDAGKAKVSQNRTVHGLTGAFQVLPGENADRFHQLWDQLMLDEKPVGIAEVELVKKMAEHTWLAERAGRLQEACFLVVAQTPEQLADNQGPGSARGAWSSEQDSPSLCAGVAGPPSCEMRVRPELERYLRYQAHHNREYSRASNELLKRRRERRQIENGFESQRRAEAQEQRRDRREKQHEERHKTAVATDQKRLEHLEMKVLTQTAAAAKRLNLFEAPRKGEIAA